MVCRWAAGQPQLGNAGAIATKAVSRVQAAEVAIRALAAGAGVKRHDLAGTIRAAHVHAASVSTRVGSPGALLVVVVLMVATWAALSRP